MNRLIDTLILSGLSAAGNFVLGYSYFGAVKAASLAMLH